MQLTDFDAGAQWKRDWDQVKYCSECCRRASPP
ncbi:DUF2256 domain-containing protein [Massilia sp. CT11-108]